MNPFGVWAREWDIRLFGVDTYILIESLPYIAFVERASYLAAKGQYGPARNLLEILRENGSTFDPKVYRLRSLVGDNTD